MTIVMRVLADLQTKKQETLQTVNIRGKVHLAPVLLYINTSWLHAPFNDDEWCYCPFLKTLNQKWHELIKLDSG